MGKNLLGRLILLPISLLNTLFRGYVLAALWAWFVIPQFPLAPNLSVVGAIGIMIVLGLFSAPSLTDKQARELNDKDATELTLYERGIQIATNTVTTSLFWFSG